MQNGPHRARHQDPAPGLRLTSVPSYAPAGVDVQEVGVGVVADAAGAERERGVAQRAVSTPTRRMSIALPSMCRLRLATPPPRVLRSMVLVVGER